LSIYQDYEELNTTLPQTKQLKDPTLEVLSTIHRKSTGTYSFTATKDGRYEYCFSNEMSSVSPKVLR
jgi:hypothetical protein